METQAGVHGRGLRKRNAALPCLTQKPSLQDLGCGQSPRWELSGGDCASALLHLFVGGEGEKDEKEKHLRSRPTTTRQRTPVRATVKRISAPPSYTSDPPLFSVQAQPRPSARAVLPCRPENGPLIRLLTPTVNAGRQKVPDEATPIPHTRPAELT